MVNQVILLGKVSKDIDVKFVSNGNMKTTLNIVTTESFKKDGEQKYKDSFHRVILWGDGWSWLQERVQKGMQVYIEGKLDYSNYEKNGEKVYSTDIVGHKVLILK